MFIPFFVKTAYIYQHYLQVFEWTAQLIVWYYTHIMRLIYYLKIDSTSILEKGNIKKTDEHSQVHASKFDMKQRNTFKLKSKFHFYFLNFFEFEK